MLVIPVTEQFEDIKGALHYFYTRYSVYVCHGKYFIAWENSCSLTLEGAFQSLKKYHLNKLSDEELKLYSCCRPFLFIEGDYGFASQS